MMPDQWRDRRLGWCDLWMRETSEGNPYAHPISGLKIIVDVNTLEVLEIEDHHDYGLPEVDGEYDPRVRGSMSAPISSRWRSASRRGSPLLSMAMRCGGRTGRCGWVSTSARVL